MRSLKIKLLSLLLLPPFYAAAETPNATGNIPSLTNNPHFMNNPTANPTFNNTPVYETKIKPQFITHTTSTINAVGVQVRDITLKMIEKAQETFTKKKFNDAKEIIKQLMWDYRYRIAASTMLTFYTSTNIFLLTDYYYLKDAECWSQWKSNCSFEHICSIPQTELAQELIRAIGEHHYNKKNPNDASHPLITFIAAIETEIKTCKRYLMVTKIIKQLRLMPIFPTNDSKINQINTCLERCLFIKHIFLSWLTERNLMTKVLKNLTYNHTKMLIGSSY